nr:hypothetical protein [Peribacillus kribbensis]
MILNGQLLRISERRLAKAVFNVHSKRAMGAAAAISKGASIPSNRRLIMWKEKSI